MSVYTDLFDSMLEDIYTLTARRDLDAETSLALRTATLSVHSYDTFVRDAVTMPVKLPNASYQTSVDVQTLLPGLRGVSTVRILDEHYQPMDRPRIDVVEMGDIYEIGYDVVKQNIAYLAGTALNVRSDVAASGYLIEYFKLPQVRREQYNSWVAQLAPEIIAYLAASIVLATNGNEEKAKSFSGYVDKTLRPQLIQNFLTTAMR